MQKQTLHHDLDHFFAHLLGAALREMLGNKVEWIYVGASYPGFVCHVRLPFAISDQYLAPLTENMERLLQEDSFSLKVFLRQNAIDCFRSFWQQALVDQISECDDEEIPVLQVGSNYYNLFFGHDLEICREKFFLEKVQPLALNEYRIVGRRKTAQQETLMTHQQLGLEEGLFFKVEERLCLTAKGVVFYEEIKDLLEKSASEEGIEWVKSGSWNSKTEQRHRQSGKMWVTEWFPCHHRYLRYPIDGLKWSPEWSEDRFHLFSDEPLDELERRCLRFIEKWTNLLQIRGRFVRTTKKGGKFRTLYRIVDPFGVEWDGPIVEGKEGSILKGSLFGSLERTMAIMMEEKQSGKRI